MIVIDNNKKIGVNLQGKSSCQHNKIWGHSFFAYKIFVHGTMIKENTPHFFYLKTFLRENPCIALKKEN